MRLSNFKRRSPLAVIVALVGLVGAGLTTAQVGAGSTVTPMVVTGNSHTCALFAAGAVKCWGSNGGGQLGDNNAPNESHLPVAVVGLSSGVTAITAGAAHTCALLVTGAVKCWGVNGSGQVGDADAGVNKDEPVSVVGLGTDSAVLAISAGGGHHTCALLSTGAVKCWGYNPYGQVGDRTSVDRDEPVNVSGLGLGVRAVSAGGYHTCALFETGAVKCWGYNPTGQLGDNSATNRDEPVDVNGLGAGVAAIRGGLDHTCALTETGAAKCWGANAFGQVGDNSTTNRNEPVGVSGLDSGVAGLSGGVLHTCALLLTGEVKCWGDNQFGQLGDNSHQGRLTPASVSALPGPAAMVSAGGVHTCALLVTGTVNCWGNNGAGQLGDGTTSDRDEPVAVAGLDLTPGPLATGTFTVVSTGLPYVPGTWTRGPVLVTFVCDGGSGINPGTGNTYPASIRVTRTKTLALSYRWRCMDSDGNVADAPAGFPALIRIDRRAPTCSIVLSLTSVPRNGAPTLVTATVNGTDADSGVATKQIVSVSPAPLAGGPTLPDASPGTWTLVGASGRVFTFTGEVRDNAGNVQTCTKKVVSR